jgi:hypothetical protein
MQGAHSTYPQTGGLLFVGQNNGRPKYNDSQVFFGDPPLSTGSCATLPANSPVTISTFDLKKNKIFSKPIGRSELDYFVYCV